MQRRISIMTQVSILALALGIFLIAGCSGNDRGVDLSQEKSQLKQNLQDARESIDNRLEEIGDQMAQAGDDMKAELSGEQTRLEKLKNDIGESLDSLGDQTEETWENFKRSADEAIVSVKAELGITSNEKSSGGSY